MKKVRALFVLAAFIWAAPSWSSERLQLSDKSLPIQDQVEKVFANCRDQLEPAPEPQSEKSFPIEDLPKELTLAKTLQLEKIDHPRVQYYMSYFTGPAHNHFQNYLDRSGYYQEYIQAELREHQLPESLFYLALIESGLNPYALSRAGAGGVWQFMPGTARRFDLRVDFWVDDRRDLEKSTHAAINYLTDLYNMFGSWPLALAGYNAGEGKVSRAVEKYDTDNYWELIEYPCLRLETKDYLPKMIAASIIAENPEKYGFAPPQKMEMAYELVEVKDPVDLNKVAHYTGTSIDDIRWLNPSLRMDISPPGSKYNLKIPVGTTDKLLAALDNLKPEQVLSYYRHRVRKGETVASICRKYGANPSEIQNVNHISPKKKLKAGSVLIIPVHTRSSGSETAKSQPVPEKINDDPGSKIAVRYTVVKGDTLFKISQAANTGVNNIKSWNKIDTGVSVGQELTLYLSPTQANKFKSWAKSNKSQVTSSGSELKKVYKVRPGDTIWAIARNNQVDPHDIMAWNNLKSNSILQPGDNIVLILKK